MRLSVLHIMLRIKADPGVRNRNLNDVLRFPGGNGDDAAAGTKEAPLKTLERALDRMKNGAEGIISVASNLVPAMVAELSHNMLEGKVDEAEAMHAKLLPLFKNCFVESNPIPTKAALNAMGLMKNELRLPLVPASQPAYDLMVQTVKELGIL